MLACDANCFSNINLRVELLVPLRVRKVVLAERVKCKFLVKNGRKWVLILRLHQNSLLDQSTQCQWIIRRAHHIPIGVLLHPVLEKLCALSDDEQICLTPVLGQIRILLSVGLPLVAVCSLLCLSHFNGDILFRSKSPCSISFSITASFIGASGSTPAVTAACRMACCA